jgi:hypothetical protein
MEDTRTKHCQRCTREYTPTGRTQKWCPACRKQLKNEQIKKRNRYIRELQARGEKPLPYCQYCKKRAPQTVIRETSDTVRKVCIACGKADWFIERDTSAT